MSRSGYVDDWDDTIQMINYRGAVLSALRGARGQKLLREMLAAMDAMEHKELAAGVLIDGWGACCALGTVAKVRGIDVSKLDPEDSHCVAEVFDIADSMAREIAFENDEGGPYKETEAQRFTRMRAWVVSNIKEPTT